MPPAAVYVLAIVGTVGAAIAFKEFVYDPHLSHVVKRLKDEFRLWRRGPVLIEVAENADEPDVAMQGRRNPSRMDEDPWGNPDIIFGDGLLSRGRFQDENMTSSSIELDNLVARELTEWRNEVVGSSGRELRQRRLASRQSALEESNHPIPYVPLSPRRTHVLFDSGSPSPPPTLANVSRLSNAPAAVPAMSGMDVTGTQVLERSLPSPPQSHISSPPCELSSLSGSNAASESPLLRRSVSQSQPKPDDQTARESLEIKTQDEGALSPPISPPSILPLSALSVPQVLSSPSGVLLPPPPPPFQQAQNSPYLQHVPSLSQSYPQELDAEHGLELLSPPSSRADSPFSMADISPRPVLTHTHLSGKVLDISDRPSSALSIGNTLSDVSVPATPPKMGLGNESFDTLSPIVGPRQLALRAASLNAGVSKDGGSSSSGMQQTASHSSGSYASPFLDPASPVHLRGMGTPRSGTGSAKSTTYLSFTESGDEGAVDDNVALATRRASVILSVSNSQRPQSEGGLGLTFVSPPSPGNPPLLSPSMPSPRSSLAHVPRSSYLHPRSPSDSELSDLDLISDDAHSEAELISRPQSVNGRSPESGRTYLNLVADTGLRSSPYLNVDRPAAYDSDRESDASWSVAGGSDFGEEACPQTPQLKPMSSSKVNRDATIRGRRGK